MRRLLLGIIFLSSLCGLAQADIVLKVMGLNPSKEQVQTVTLKAYLPREVKPEDVLDKGDLEVVYDTQLGTYYVFGEYELQPKESIQREIQIKDVWSISQGELYSVNSEAKQTIALLEKTDLQDRAKFLKESIESKLKEIADRQSVASVNPQKRISEYRENTKLLDSVRADLSTLRSMLAQAKPVSIKSVWLTFFVVVGFLGLLALSLYFIWHKQLQAINDFSLPGAKETRPLAQSPVTHSAKNVKGFAQTDVEKILRDNQK